MKIMPGGWFGGVFLAVSDRTAHWQGFDKSEQQTAEQTSLPVF